MKVQEEYQQLVGIVRPPMSALILRKPAVRPSTSDFKPSFLQDVRPTK